MSWRTTESITPSSTSGCSRFGIFMCLNIPYSAGSLNAKRNARCRESDLLGWRSLAGVQKAPPANPRRALTRRRPPAHSNARRTFSLTPSQEGAMKLRLFHLAFFSALAVHGLAQADDAASQ